MNKISCICPTYNRHGLLMESIKMFMDQTYKNKELIIIDDSFHRFDQFEQLNILYTNLEDVKYYYVDKMTIGSKRNLAISYATGDIIAFWDDDDYYHPTRLEYQASFMNNKKQFIFFKNVLYYDLHNRIIYRTSKYLQRRLWQFRGIILTSMMFYKHICNYVKFKNVNIIEDLYFVKKSILRYKYDYELIENNKMFVYIKHNKCAWHIDFDVNGFYKIN